MGKIEEIEFFGQPILNQILKLEGIISLIRTQVWCILIAQLLMTVIRKIARAQKVLSVVASFIRIHLTSMPDMVELPGSTNRGYNAQIGESPG